MKKLFRFGLVGGLLLVGLLIGLAHLTRADGILLLPIVACASLIQSRPRTTFHVSRFTFHA